MVVTGGGSGGHITPLLAVAHELKRISPETEVIFVGQRGDALGDIPAEDKNIDRLYTVRAGKFRRYHGESFWQHLMDVSTLVKNIRDAFWVVIGMGQSYRLLKHLRPDVVFVKGGFVGVPVGLAAAWLKIPYITHDSDALPGLANRIVARWATKHAVALPAEVYHYPKRKTVTVGVPVSHHYQVFSSQQVKTYRKQLQLDQFDPLILVTGGGLGAQLLNNAVIANAQALLERYPHAGLVHIAGRNHEVQVRQRYKQLLGLDAKRVVVKGFVSNLYLYSGVADVIVTRAGATAIAEFAAQAKPCVVVPNPKLTGGHQLKNAQELQERKAIRVVNEAVLREDHLALMAPLVELLDHPDQAARLGQRLQKMTHPDAAKELAVLLLEVAGGQH